DPASAENDFVLKWNRDPEEFDFRFVRSGNYLLIEIYQYPTSERDAAERHLVYSPPGSAREIISAFAETFEQLYEDRDTDEFEFNWRQPFPLNEFREFRSVLERESGGFGG